MNFLPTTRNKFRRLSSRTRLVLISSGLLIVLGVLVFVRPPLITPLSDAGHDVSAPLWEVRSDVVAAVYGAFRSLESKQSLISENIALQEQTSVLRKQAFESSLLARENNELKMLLGRKKVSGDKDLLASVLRGVDTTPYDSLIVDVGSADGVYEGDLVTADGGVAIGSVRKVFSNTATVVLFSTPHEKTAVLIGGATSTVPAIAEGQGGGTFMALLPREVDVSVGDSVSLSTLNSVLFAMIERVEADPVESFERIFFKNPVNVGALRFVIIKRGFTWRPGVEETATPDENNATKEQ